MNVEAVVGLNIREAPSSTSAKLGLLPRGCRVEIGERSPNGKWARIRKILDGAALPACIGGEANQGAIETKGWVFLGELDAEPREPHALDQVVFPEKPIPIKAGELVGHVGEYQQYDDAQLATKRGWRSLLHLEVFTGDDVSAFIKRSRVYANGPSAGNRDLFVIEQGAKLVLARRPDAILSLDGSVRVTSDSPKEGLWAKVQRTIVQIQDRKSLGDYDPGTNAYAGNVGWSGWYVGKLDSQRTRSKAEAKRLRYERRETWRPNGPALWVERKALQRGGQAAAANRSVPAWSSHPLSLKNAGAAPATFARVLTSDELARFPLERCAVDEEGRRWWHLAVRTGGGVTEGWACEKGHANVTFQSPWAWPGFELLEERGTKPLDFRSRALIAMGLARPHEIKDFKARADKIEGGRLFEKLYACMDTSDDNNLDIHELRKAMAQPLLAQSLSRVIARYESEWGGGMSKWDELDQLMSDGIQEWKAEKLRIKRLQWWPEVVAAVAGFPANAEVFHFHPIGLISNFAGAASSSLDELIRRVGDVIAHGEGSYDSYNTGTKGVVGGRVGHSFPNPPAGSVTGKTINEILSTEALPGTNRNRMFATGKYQTVLATLRKAKTSMKLSGNERYDATMQERVFAEFLIYKAGGGALARFVFEGEGSIDDAQYAASKEWASIAVPPGRKISGGRVSQGTLSYYESAANHANARSTSSLRAILQEIARSR